VRGKNVFQGDYYLEDLHDYGMDRRIVVVYLDPESSNPDSEGTSVERYVDYDMANRFRKNLNAAVNIIEKRRTNAGILVDMSSIGGEWQAGLMIMSEILCCPVPVTVVAKRVARSMSSLIPLSADRSVLYPSTRYMIHRGEYEFQGLDQNACTDDIERRKCGELMLQIYTARLSSRGKHRHKNKQAIHDLLKTKMKERTDVWMSPGQAVKEGFVHAVFDGDWNKLRARRINKRWREKLLKVLAAPIVIAGTVSFDGKITDTFGG